MKMHPTPLSGLTLVETSPVCDERGQFMRVFCEEEFSEIYPHVHWVQANLSRTSCKGTVRGMHFQYAPMAEAKLIRCLRGRIRDVAVDLRVGSPTLLRWHAVELAQDSAMQVFIPEGFAHGFQALTDDVELLYLHTAAWSRAHEGGVRHDDPALSIRWPLPVSHVSDKDRSMPLLSPDFAGIES